MHGSVSQPSARVTGNVLAMPATRGGIDVRDAAYHTAHQFPGGVPAMAQRLGVNENTLAHKVSLRKDTHHLSLVE